MSRLEKAKLQEVRADENETPEGEPVAVQFNPTSLRLRISNSIEGGQSKGRQRRQQNAKSSTVLTLELVFDSADEGENGAPVSVRRKTELVERYVLAREDGTETPPKLRFEWNEFIVTGIVESVDLDFDLFAPDGTPLRAKVNLSLKEQDSNYMLLRQGAGARTSDNSRRQGGGSNGRPGSEAGAGSSDRSAPALEGETAPEFAARKGLDPTAWRGLEADLTSGLSLEAGAEIGFNASLSASAGIGFSAGVQAGLDISLEASVGLDASLNASVAGGASAGFGAEGTAGFLLSAAGGVSAAIETVKIAEAQNAEAEATRAFSAPNNPTADISAGRGPQAANAPIVRTAGISAGATIPISLERTPVPRAEPTRTPLVTTGWPSYSQQMETPTRAPTPKADPRRVSYGVGVPLRPTYGTVVANAPIGICVSARSGTALNEGFKTRQDPTIAPWIELPRLDPMRAKADAAQARARVNPCRMLYGTSHRGGKT